MAGFLRGKQAGIQNDLSAGILPGLFAPDDQFRYGINSQIGYVGADLTPRSLDADLDFHEQIFSIRPHTISSCHRHKRNDFWQW